VLGQILFVFLVSFNQYFFKFSLFEARQRTGGGYKWRTELNEPITHYLAQGVELREDWDEVCDSIMEKAVFCKFSQNAFLRDKLLSTAVSVDTPLQGKKTTPVNKGKLLVEHTYRDSYWGDGGDGSGVNMLGKLLIRVRDRLLELQTKATEVS